MRRTAQLVELMRPVSKTCSLDGERTSSAPAATNGHAHAHVHAPGNGHAATPANGNGHAAAESLPAFSSDRVDELLARLSAEQRARIVVAWLRAEILI